MTKNQRKFFDFLGSNFMNEFDEASILEACGLSPESFRVYVTNGRYDFFLEKIIVGWWRVICPPGLTEEEFVARVTQTKRSHVKPDAGDGSVSYHKSYSLSPTPLGEGGFAVVYHATHRTSKVSFALKRCKPEPAARERIRREIDVLKNLEHKNVMKVLDFDPGCMWYTMPLATERLVSNGKPTDSVPLREVVFDVLSAIEYLHEHQAGTVHRDVSPGNILKIEDDEFGSRWVLSDFGTVRRPAGQTTQHLTVVGSLLGTEHFAAPELWDDAHKADYRTDIYGLGRVVAWLLGEKLVPNIPAKVQGEWSSFVRLATQLNIDDRAESIEQIRLLIPGSQSKLSDSVIDSQNRVMDSGTLQPLRDERLIAEAVEAEDCAICEQCNPGEDRGPALVSYVNYLDVEGFQVGTCAWCSNFAVRCVRCGIVTPVSDDTESVECRGGCGAFFRVESTTDKNGINQAEISVRPAG
jgi:tRNA A-37 threonylcarbamoyl transferase component Bud32